MKNIILLLIALSFGLSACSQEQKSTTSNNDTLALNPLTKQEAKVILQKGTERPFSGIFEQHYEAGTYTCKHCDAPLFESDTKFDAHCGWPSFDEAIDGAVKEVPDADGHRTEILCANCNGHLGHVFKGEGFTDKNVRHCVNSISLSFIPENEEDKIDTVYFAGGCFWGVEYYLHKLPGVLSTEVGYTGGMVDKPTYEQVCTGQTGHAEVVRVIYHRDSISYRKLAQQFFELHDFTDVDRQGPDIGNQYRTEIFYTKEYQKTDSEALIDILSNKGYKVATKVTAASAYYSAENYHQDYYDKKGTLPYCHAPKEIF